MIWFCTGFYVSMHFGSLLQNPSVEDKNYVSREPTVDSA